MSAPRPIKVQGYRRYPRASVEWLIVDARNRDGGQIAVCHDQTIAQAVADALNANLDEYDETSGWNEPF